MNTPMDDRFVIISEHKDDEFFISTGGHRLAPTWRHDAM
jgi:hypothetical protein